MTGRIGRAEVEALAREYCELRFGHPNCTIYKEFLPGGWCWLFTREIDGEPDYRHGAPIGRNLKEAHDELMRRIERLKGAG